MDHIVFRGIVPELEKEVTAINTYLIKGTRPEHLEMTLPDPDPESPPGAQVQCCFVGNAMAEFAKLPFPDYTAQIVLVTVTPDLRRPRIRKYLINGVFKTGRYDYDRSVVILSLENAMELVDSRGGVSGLSLRLDNYRNATEVIKTLQDKLGPDYILTRFLMALILSFIMVLAGFCIFAVVTTTVHEKRKDIGIMKAVGFTPGMIARAFLVNGLAIGLIGAVLGVAGGLLFANNINEIKDAIESLTGFNPFPAKIYYFDTIPTDSGLLMPMLVAAGAIVCSLVFSLVPALRAARLDPVQTLRFE